ncbi:MAG: hypothetical protein ACTTKY_02500 [Catonella sp.]
MAEEKKYILDGYRFNDSDSYEQARRELNKIAEIKSEQDLKDETELRAVYDRLVESGEFTTPVGIGFLREAQKRLVKNPEQRKTMKAIPYFGNVYEKTEADDLPKDSIQKESVNDETEGKETGSETNPVLIKNFKLKLRNYRIIIAFMAVMILIPFGIVAYDKIFSSNAREQAMIDEYASWKEELTKKEQELNERERMFEGMADKEVNSEVKAGE